MEPEPAPATAPYVSTSMGIDSARLELARPIAISRPPAIMVLGAPRYIMSLPSRREDMLYDTANTAKTVDVDNACWWNSEATLLKKTPYVRKMPRHEL